MAFVLKFEFLFNYLIINDKNKYDVIKKKRICYFDNGYFLKYFLFKNILRYYFFKFTFNIYNSKQR